MAERKDRAIVNVLESVTQALHKHHNQLGDELCGLGKFQRNSLSKFKGRYDPDGAQVWIKEIKKIFRVKACTEEQKLLFGTHMLSEEAKD